MEKAKTLYLIISGGVSGDLWHVAAAQIQAKKYASGYRLVAVVAVAAEDNSNDISDNKDFQQGRITFNFLRDLDLEVALAIVPKPNAFAAPGEKSKGIGKVPLENIMYRQDPQVLGNLCDKQSGILPNRFDDFLFHEGRISPNLPLPESVVDQPLAFFTVKPDPPTGHHPFLQLMVATTIAIQDLYKQDQQRRVDLADALASGIINESQENSEMFGESSDKGKKPDEPSTNFNKLELPRTKKVLDVKEIQFSKMANLAIDHFNEQKAKANRGLADTTYTDKVVLYNNRKGEVNQGTNSVEPMRIWFYKEAWKNNLAVLEVATGLGADVIQGINNEYAKKKGKPQKDSPKEEDMQSRRFVFDIYDKQLKAPYPGLNPTVQAALWHKIGAKAMVFGMFSSRTGSADIAGLTGVNTFFWDDPNMQFLIGEGKARFTVSNRGTKGIKEFLEGVPSQIPQCLRSLLLYPIMGVGQPLPAPSDVSELGEMRETPFKQWIGGRKPWEADAPINRPSLYPSFNLNLSEPGDSSQIQPVLIDYIKDAMLGGNKKREVAKKSIEAVQKCSFEMFRDGYIERKEHGIVAQALHDLGIFPEKDLQIFPGKFPGEWDQLYELAEPETD